MFYTVLRAKKGQKRKMTKDHACCTMCSTIFNNNNSGTANGGMTF